MFDYEKWIGEQSEEIKTGIEAHFSGLLNTVKATRQERDDRERELKELAKKVEAGSEAGKLVSELRERLAKETKKSNFLESAVKVGVRNSSAAYAVASAENLFLDDGNPDWDKIKGAAPELFTQVINSDAGSGTNQKPTGTSNAAFKKALESGKEVRVKTIKN